MVVLCAMVWFALFRRGERGPAELPPEYLKRPIPYTWYKGMTIKEVFDRLQTLGNVPIEVHWGALAAEGITPDRRLFSRDTDGPFALALDRVITNNELKALGYRAERDRIVVYPKGEARAAECRVYDVRDWFEGISRQPKAWDGDHDWQEEWRLKWQPAGASLADIPQEATEGHLSILSSGRPLRPEDPEEALWQFIDDRAPKRFLDAYEGGQIYRSGGMRFYCGRLIVIAPPNVQEEIAALLAYLRGHPQAVQR